MKKQRNGFTMIEVALVLGIAGLIFLMTFIALPALQRQARDAQRERDMAYFIEMAKKYQTNNRGALPINGNAIAGEFTRDPYLVNFVDPSGENYQYAVYDCMGSTGGSAGDKCNKVITMIDDLNSKSFDENKNTLRVVQNAKCTGDSSGVVFAPNSRKMAVLYKLEGGGIHCENT